MSRLTNATCGRLGGVADCAWCGRSFTRDPDSTTSTCSDYCSIAHRVTKGRDGHGRLAAPAAPGPQLPRRTSSDYCHTCGCGDWHWTGCEEGA